MFTDDEHLGRSVQELGAEARERRAEFERDRRVSEDLFRRTGEAGLFRQMLPVSLGGLGRRPVAWFRTGIDLATWESSWGWITTQGAADMATYMADGHPDFAAAFLADTRCYSSSSSFTTGTLTPDADGFRLDGSWPFCSGCTGATWVGGEAAIVGSEGRGGAAEIRYALVPAARAKSSKTGTSWA